MAKSLSFKLSPGSRSATPSRAILATKRFGYNKYAIGKIHFRANINNLFLTLTDIKNRVIYTRSTGMCTQEKNKRQQLSPLVIKTMVSDIAKKMYKLKMVRIEIVIRTRARRLFKNFMSYVRQNRIHVISIVDKRRLPHNGVRGKARTRK